jgi:predicted Zn finger-like uncharacterized protein
MDVTCERCKTEYEFDDALVSERGTTVKCTNCGHQFKVRRTAASGAPEAWRVRTVDGRELEFRALRELQAAIAQQTITRDDVLSRGATRPRRLGSIAELEPFFASATMAVSAYSTTPGIGGLSGGGPSAPHVTTPRPRNPTPLGLGAITPSPSRYEGSVAIPLPTAPGVSPTSQAHPRITPGDADETTNVLPPTIAPRQGPSAPRAPAIDRPSFEPPSVDPATRRAERVPSAPIFAGAAATEAVVNGALSETLPAEQHRPHPPRRMHQTLPAGTPRDPSKPLSETPPRALPALPSEPAAPVPAASPEVAPRVDAEVSGEMRGSAPTPPPPTATPTPGAVRASYERDSAFHEPRFSAPPTRRGGSVRWIAGVVLVGVLALAGATVGRKLFAPAGGASNERVVALLKDGETSLSQGDLDQAKELFDKASALAEKDPKVAADLAQLAVVRADISWLHRRLIAADDPEQPNVKKELDDRLARATRAVDEATQLAPDDLVVTRARIEALRMKGDLDGARKLVSKLGGAPDAAYTLASLDLAEDKPGWAPLIDRLRSAVGNEQGLGRARSALVYALARSGDVAGAKVELDKLAAMPKGHPLMASLRTFLQRAESGKALDPTQLPDVPVSSSEASADFREAIRQGNLARAKGDLKRAEQMYQSALKSNPGDVEALTGLAEVARAKKDGAAATKAFETILAKSPQYVPALAGLADIKWDAGDKAGAQALYKQVIERGGQSGPYAARALERLGVKGDASGSRSGSGSSSGRVPDDYVAPQGTIDTTDLPGQKPPPHDDKPAPPPTTPPTTPPAPTTPPGVDTSDLPGFK